jgi:signal transduction histidine kinase
LSGIQEITRITDLVEMIADISRRKHKDEDAAKGREEIYLNEIAEPFLRILQYKADAERLKRIEPNYAPELSRQKESKGHPILGKRAQIGQIIFNLVNNAIDASSEGKRIDVSTRMIEVDGRKFAVLRVTDYGHGMDDDVKRRIFTPFFTTKEMGMGLGLYVVKKIVEGFNGKIELKTGPGRGTTFEVRFPVEQ